MAARSFRVPPGDPTADEWDEPYRADPLAESLTGPPGTALTNPSPGFQPLPEMTPEQARQYARARREAAILHQIEAEGGPVGALGSIAEAIPAGTIGYSPSMAEGAGRGDLGDLSGLAVGMLLGPRAQTADLGALKTARRMKLEGATPTEIRNATGWEELPSGGQWGFEISDKPMKEKVRPFPLKMSYRDKQKAIAEGKLYRNWADVYDHPELVASYPQLGTGEVMAQIVKAGHPEGVTKTGEYHPPGGKARQAQLIISMGKDAAERKGVATHETQHLVQSFEDWPRGGSNQDPALEPYAKKVFEQMQKTLQPNMVRMKQIAESMNIDPALLKYPDTNNRVMQAYYKMFPTEARQFVRKLSALKDIPGSFMFDAYLRLAGEDMARTTSRRGGMSEKEIMATPRWLHEDVPPEHQITRWGDRDSQNPHERGNLPMIYTPPDMPELPYGREAPYFMGDEPAPPYPGDPRVERPYEAKQFGWETIDPKLSIPTMDELATVLSMRRGR